MSEPTARELLDSNPLALAPFYGWPVLAARVERVLALHCEVEGDDSDGSYAVTSVCSECGQPWPCPTRRLLNGEEP